MGAGSSLILEAGSLVKSNCAIAPNCALDPSGGSITINGSVVFDPGNGIGSDNYSNPTGSTNYGDATLPVELISFIAEPKDFQTLMVWSTATELNNDRFVLEHSMNGEDWNVIATLKGSGTSNTAQSYSYSHLFPGFGINYYRLNQIDFDGTSEYVGMISILHSGQHEFTVYPNPSSHGNITVGLPETGLLTITDISGRIVREMNPMQMTVLVNLSSGTYIVRFEQNGHSVQKRILVN